MNYNHTLQSLHVGLPEDILRLKLFGDFEEALKQIDGKLKENIPKGLRHCLIAQRKIIERLPCDFTLNEAAALDLAKEQIPDFSKAELEELTRRGRILWIFDHGEKRYFNRFVETLLKAEPGMVERSGIKLASGEAAQKGSEGDQRLESAREKMKEAGSLGFRVRIKAGLRINKKDFRPGRAEVYLPIPAACEQQSEIRIESIDPPQGQASDEKSLQRTIHWSMDLKENREFTCTYSYIHRAYYKDISKMVSSLEIENKEELIKEEPPHILFTPYLKELTEELTRDLVDDLEKARAIYDFITRNMKYTFMPAYFSLENIAENCARNYSGDCGVFALLFITLCRCAGIACHWQSGLVVQPDFLGGHDWVRLFIPGKGWIYADPSFGISAHRLNNEDRRRFYFGNVDPYRVVFNNAFQKDFQPAMESWRADPYDNQLGEVELAGEGLAFNQVERFKEVLSFEEHSEAD